MAWLWFTVPYLLLTVTASRIKRHSGTVQEDKYKELYLEWPPERTRRYNFVPEDGWPYSTPSPLISTCGPYGSRRVRPSVMARILGLQPFIHRAYGTAVLAVSHTLVPKWHGGHVCFQRDGVGTTPESAALSHSGCHSNAVTAPPY
jgi:hypothetical protein